MRAISFRLRFFAKQNCSDLQMKVLVIFQILFSCADISRTQNLGLEVEPDMSKVLADLTFGEPVFKLPPL